MPKIVAVHASPAPGIGLGMQTVLVTSSGLDSLMKSGVISADIAMGGYSPTEKRRSTDVWAVLQSMANEDKFTKTYTFDEIRAAMPGLGEAKLRQTLEMLSQNAKINYRSDGTIKVYNV